MSERRPNDVFAKSAIVVHRCIQANGTFDEKWHWGAYAEECLRARDAELAKDAEISRLRAELHNKEREFLNAESERQTLRDAVNVYQPQILALRAALKPFADLSSVYVRRAETFGWKDTDGVYGAADSEMDATIRVADCRAALKALEDRP